MGIVFRWRKKPVEIDAMRFDGTRAGRDALQEWSGGAVRRSTINSLDFCTDLGIETLEGTMRVDNGDWVIKGIKGEFYPCKPDIFDQTYDPVMRRCDCAACNCGGSHQVTSLIN